MTTTDPTPQRWFHGTNAALSVGEQLVPGNSINVSNWPLLDNSWGVWVTPNPELAAAYGSHVYEVAPEGEITDWADENGWERDEVNDEFVCDSARIIAHVPATVTETG